MKSLIENYAFDERSLEGSKKRTVYYKQRKEREEKKRKNGVDERESDDEDEEGDKIKIPYRETSLLVSVLINVISVTPNLVPHFIFREINPSELLSSIRKDDFIHTFFKDDQKKYSLLDVLFRVLLWRDGTNALFIVGSLLKTKKEIIQINNEDIDIRYVYLIKFFEIMTNMLEVETKKSVSFKTFESMMLRRSIGRVIQYITIVIADEELNFSTKKEEVHSFIVNLTQKLLQNVGLFGKYLINSNTDGSMIDIISDIINENTKERMEVDEIRKSYAIILQTLEKGDRIYTKEFNKCLEMKYESLVFKSNKEMNIEKLNPEEQKDFEHWSERDVWEKEETKKLLILAKVLQTNDKMIPDIKFPLTNQVCVAGGTNNFSGLIHQNDLSLQEIFKFYRNYGNIVDENNADRLARLKFYEDWNHEKNKTFNRTEGFYSQTLNYIRSENKPEILKIKQKNLGHLNEKSNM